MCREVRGGWGPAAMTRRRADPAGVSRCDFKGFGGGSAKVRCAFRSISLDTGNSDGCTTL